CNRSMGIGVARLNSSYPPTDAFAGTPHLRRLSETHFSLSNGIRPPYARDHAGDEQEFALALPRGGLASQLVEILPALGFRLLAQALQVPDRDLLHVLEVDGAALAHVAIEQGLIGLAAADPAQLLRQIERIVDAAIQAERADGIVEMRCIAGEQHAADAKVLRHALMHLVDALVLDRVGARPWLEALHA